MPDAHDIGAEKAEKQAAKVPVLSSKVDEYKRAVAEAEVKALLSLQKSHARNSHV